MTTDNKMITGNDFSGPLFIVGMPRSGTKLLRDLINQHPKIKIPEIESHFIPFFIEKFGNPPSFSSSENRKAFMEEFEKTAFFWNFKNKNIVLDFEELERTVDFKSWNEIFAYIFKFYAPKTDEKNFIWGDKTPGYINHLQLLNEIFPNARFIHILRDPRDYSLSVRKAWGKSIYRAAHRWNITISQATKDAKVLNNRYLEVHYEDLLKDAEKTLRKICSFLNVDFTASMLTLAKPSENLGDAKGRTTIVTENMNKYLQLLNHSQIAKIEEITYPMLKELNYPITTNVKHKPLNKYSLKLIYMYDTLKTFAFHIKEKGFVQGIQYTLNHKIRSSW